MTNDMDRRIIQLAADILGEPVSSICRETTPADIETWDSLAQLNLMVALEDEFAIELVPEDLGLMTSVGAIVDLITLRLA